MDRTSRWRELIERPDQEIPLDEAALLISAGLDPSVDVVAQLDRLDELASQIGTTTTAQLCRFMFGTLGLRGDRHTYDDPRNSCLDQVLERRLGIPISLSVLLIEVGRRCGVVLEGIGMPGHFLVRDPDDPDHLIDAFSGGQYLDHSACAQLLHAAVGPAIEFQPEMIASVDRRSILFRMLTNLDHSFRRRGDRRGLTTVTTLCALIPGLPLARRMELADELARLGCYDQASTLLGDLAVDPGISVELARSLQARSRGLVARYN